MNLSSTERRLVDSIAARAGDLLEQLRTHVAIPTGHNYTAGLDEYRDILTARLARLGADIKRVEGGSRPSWLEQPGQATDRTAAPPTILAHHPSRGASPRILIAGHLDTVHDPDGPFRRLTVSGDGQRATGPGAADMKGGILVAVTALEALAEAGVDLSWTMILTCDEESGSYLSEAALRAAAKEHDWGFVVEPALPGGALAVERGGSGQFQIEVFGRSAHVGREFAEGISAVVELARIITKLQELVRVDEGVVVNVGPIQGGDVTNTVPDYAACWGNVRFRDARQAQELGHAVDAFGREGVGLPRVVVHRSFNRPAKPSTEAVGRLADAAASVSADLGVELPFSSTGGVCDGNILQDAGLPTLDTLGVRGGNLHRDDEYIEVASLVDRAGLLAILLTRIAENRAGLEPSGTRSMSRCR